MYAENACIVHKEGFARGRESIKHLYQVICKNGERMGYMNASMLKPEFESWTKDHGYVVGVSILSHFLNPELTKVIRTKTTLLLSVSDERIRIVRDLEELL